MHGLRATSARVRRMHGRGGIPGQCRQTMLVREVTGAEGTQGTLGTPVSLTGEIPAAHPRLRHLLPKTRRISRAGIHASRTQISRLGESPPE